MAYLDGKDYTSLSEYFLDHPDEENSYYDDMAEMAMEEEFDYPEDFALTYGGR